MANGSGLPFPNRPLERVRAELSQLGFHWNNTRKCWQHPCGETLPRGTQEPRAKYEVWFPMDAARRKAKARSRATRTSRRLIPPLTGRSRWPVRLAPPPLLPMISFSDPAPATPRPRKWDAEIDKARLHPAWLEFETDIHHSATLRARVARALDRYGLGTSDIVVDEALDYLIHKELGQSARYFNSAGKAQFNQQQITHAVLSFMAVKEHQRYLHDCALHDAEPDHDDETPGIIHLPDASQIAPDEYAARRDAVHAILSMVPEQDRELYDLWLAVRENGQRGEPGTLAPAPRLRAAPRHRLEHRLLPHEKLGRQPSSAIHGLTKSPATSGRCAEQPNPRPAARALALAAAVFKNFKKISRFARVPCFSGDSRRPQAPAPKDCILWNPACLSGRGSALDPPGLCSPGPALSFLQCPAPLLSRQVLAVVVAAAARASTPYRRLCHWVTSAFSSSVYFRNELAKSSADTVTVFFSCFVSAIN